MSQTNVHLLGALSGLLPAQFDALLYCLKIPYHQVSPATVPQGSRAVELLRYAENQGLSAELESHLNEILHGRITTAPPRRQQAETLLPVVDIKCPNNLPVRRRFVGRSREIRALTEALMQSSRASVVQPASLYGLGGVGKSALALEFAYIRWNIYNGGVWWLRAEGRPIEAMAQLATDLRAVGPPDIQAVLTRLEPDAPVAKVANSVRLALQNHHNAILLILDNVDADGWNALLPGGEVRVLVTTRERRFALGEGTQLDVFSPDESVLLAQKIAGKPNNLTEAAAMERVVAVRLDGLAIAVEVASRTVKAWEVTWARYEQMLAASKEIPEERDLARDYPHDVFAVLDISINRLGPASIERSLLEAIALFAPRGVPWDWAAATASLEPDEVEGTIKYLKSLGLLILDAGRRTVSIHNLVRQRVVQHTGKERRRVMIRDAVYCVRTWMENNLDETKLREFAARCPHFRELLDVVEAEGDDTTWVSIAQYVATHLKHEADFCGAAELFRRALERTERLTPPPPGWLSASLSNLGSVLIDLENLEEGQELLERALRIDEAENGPEHPNVAIRLSILANVLQKRGDLEGAEQLLERAIRINCSARGDHDAGTATDLSNLAMVLLERNQLPRAADLLERSIEIVRKLFGPTHPKVAKRLANKALIFQSLGNLRGARDLLEEALAAMKQIYGQEHPKVATCLINLAGVHQALGDAKTAAELLRQARSIVGTTLER